MHALIVDSDENTSHSLGKYLGKLLDDPKARLRTTTTGSLDIANGLFLLTGVKFDLVICGETVESSRDLKSGNGLRLMQEFQQRYRNTPVIILSDKAIGEYSGLTTIYRKSPTLKANLEEALKKEMPYMF